MLPAPRGQSWETAFQFPGLPRPVVFASNNQQILRFTVCACPLKPHIVERVLGVPVEGLGRRTPGYERADHVGSISLLFGKYLAQVIDLCVRSDHRNPGRNDRVSFGMYLFRLAASDFFRLSSAKQSAVQAF